MYNQRKAGVLLSYGHTIINAIVGFIYIPLIIYFLGQNEYGLFQIMGSILVYLGLFDFGLGKTVTRYYSKYIALNDNKGKENLLAITSLIFLTLSFILLIVGIILYFYLEMVFGKSLNHQEIIVAKQMYLVILITAIITVGTSGFKSIVVAHEKFIFLKIVDIAQVLIRPIITLAIFMIKASALILVVIQASINITAILIIIFYAYRKLNFKMKLHFWDKDLFKSLMNFSFFIFLTALMDQVFWRSGQIILGIFVGTISVAVYSIASQFIMYYMTLSTAISGVFLPSITKKVTEKISDNELSNLFIRIGRVQYILLGMILIGFIILGKNFIVLWVGNDYIAAYSITLIIMIPFTIDLIQNIGLAILQAKNMYRFRAIVYVLMAILNIFISIPLTIKYDGLGIAIATGACFLIGNGIIMNYYYWKIVNLDIKKFWMEIFKLTIPMTLILIFMNYFLSLFSLDSIIGFILKGVFIVCFYTIIMWIFAMNSYEKSLLYSPVKKIMTNISK